LGLAAKAYVKDLLENSDDGKFSIISHGTGKYGRVLGELFIKGHEQSVNELLKEEGHAYEYTGGKKKDFKDEIAKEKAAKKEDLVDKPSEEDSENGE